MIDALLPRPASGGRSGESRDLFPPRLKKAPRHSLANIFRYTNGALIQDIHKT